MGIDLTKLVDLDELDILSRCTPLFQRGYYQRHDGKIDHPRAMTIEHPWAFIADRTANCHFWNKILFEVLFEKKMIPIGCMSCWKVVMNIPTVHQLFVVYQMMKILDLPSKCGCEISRKNTTRLYAGYFYCYSKAEGLKRLKQVREKFEAIVPAENIKLKRACTEYEQNVGPSDTWKVTQKQRDLERRATALFVSEAITQKQTEEQLAMVMRSWIRDAHSIGDMSYLPYTKGKPLFPESKTYEK